MFFVYLLWSKKSERFYVGFTPDLKARLNRHNSGEVLSTKYGTPWELVYYEAFRNKKDALIREKKLKHHGQGIRRLKERIKNDIALV